MTTLWKAISLERFRKVLSLLKDGYRYVAEVINCLTRWKLNRLLDPNWSYKELDRAPKGLKYNGLGPEEFAPAEHDHPEYVKKWETVDVAKSVRVGGVDYSPSELAPYYHVHPEYVRREDLIVEAERLNNVPADEFARKNHEHPEYLKKTDVVDAALEIGGTSFSDYAPFFHDHGSEYYLEDETVHDAWELVDDNGNSYTASSFAPARHSHDEYLTKEEADKIFLRKDEPYMAARTLEARHVVVRPTSSVDDVGTTNFALLQMPHAIDQAKSEVQVSTTIVSDRVTTVKVFGTECFTCPGRWFEYSVPESGNILAVVITPEVGVNPKIRHLTHFVAWNGNRFRIYQYDYPESYTMKVKLLIFVEVG